MLDHLTILTQEEVDDIYAKPTFSKEDQASYFFLDEREKFLMQGFSTITSKIHFILQLGYFKAKQQFYIFSTNEVMNDVEYVTGLYFHDIYGALDGTISKPTRLRQQKIIKDLLGYSDCGKVAKTYLLEKAKNLAKIHNKPIYIFRELMNYLQDRRIIFPAYTTLQRDFVSIALTYEKQRLGKIIDEFLSEEELEMLDNLVDSHVLEGENTLYLLTYLQQEPSSYRYKEMRSQVKRKEELELLYEVAKSVVPKLEISAENIKHYSALAHHYTIFSLSRFEHQMRYVYLLCFAQSHYHHINDILIEAFGVNIEHYHKKKKDFANDKVSEYHIEANAHLDTVPVILGLFTDDEIPNDIPFGEIRERAFELLPKRAFAKVSNHLLNIRLDEKALQWQFIDENKRRITQNIRYMFLQTKFCYNNPDNELKEAAKFLKRVVNASNQPKQFELKEVPLGFINQKTKKYILPNGEFSLGRYEFLVYQELAKQIDSGEIYIAESNRYKSFDEDLVSAREWENKQALIKSLDVPRLQEPIEGLLKKWKRRIDRLYTSVNQQILNKTNEDLKVSPKGNRVSWKLGKYEAQEVVDHQLYSKFAPITITQLLHLTQKKTGFLSAFTHLLRSNVKGKASHKSLYASLLAFGTNMGLETMSNHSDASYYELKGAANGYISIENLKNANDKVSNATANLPMFKHFGIEPSIIHSSSDGQRYESRFDTINSRHSSKYFGLGKGISSYTMVANHVPVNAKVIGAHEHESHYVFDIIYNNSSEINPNIHSTDTHGTNQINFAILDMFGYQFAPRYKNLVTKTEKLYSFAHPSHYQADQYVIKPSRKIDEELIVSEWDNIQRILTSLALKTTSQSSIIRKLSSYKRRNKTQKALWEYDNIVKTHYLLSFLSSKHLRSNVQKALNRGEAYHKLRKHIFYADKGKFKVHSAQEQQIWAECARLIANAIIYYNTYLLSELLVKEERAGNKEAVGLLKKVSPVAWQHIHIYGTYKFSDDGLDFDFEGILKEMQVI